MPTPGERFDRLSGAEPYKPQSRALNPNDVVIAKGWNVRDVTSLEAKEHIESLATAILARGYDSTKPISVRYDRANGIATLVDGECRLRACRKLWDAGHKIYVPSVATEGDEADLTADSLSGNAGQPLTKWEFGQGCRRLLRFGWDAKKIADYTCKSVRYVSDSIALANVSLEAKSMMAAGQVTPARVLAEVKQHGDKAVEILREVVAATPPAAKKTKKGKPEKAKPIGRKRSPVADEQALTLADKIATITLDDSLMLDDAKILAKKYLKLRGIDAPKNA
jgi:ParB family transcriptional regulator, chromosome partitioning protein